MRPSVELVVRPWVDDHEAEEGDADAALFLDEILVDGESFFPEDEPSRVTFHAHVGDFLQLRIDHPPAELAERYADPADHLLGTTDAMLLLPVGSVTTRVKVLA